jgi:hypothetical protein
MITIGKRNFEFVKSGSGTNIVFVPESFRPQLLGEESKKDFQMSINS